jgi:uncharacterized protein YhaN
MQEIEKKIDEVNERIEKVNERIKEVNQEIKEVNEEIEKVDQELNSIATMNEEEKSRKLARISGLDEQRKELVKQNKGLQNERDWFVDERTRYAQIRQIHESKLIGSDDRGIKRMALHHPTSRLIRSDLLQHLPLPRANLQGIAPMRSIPSLETLMIQILHSAFTLMDPRLLVPCHANISRKPQYAGCGLCSSLSESLNTTTSFHLSVWIVIQMGSSTCLSS